MCKSIQFAIILMAVGSSWAFAQAQQPPIQNGPGANQVTRQTAQQQNQNRPRQITNAQQQRFNQMQRGGGGSFRPGAAQANHTSAAITTNDFPPIQQVGYTQQDDTTVPSILSGQTRKPERSIENPAANGNTNDNQVKNQSQIQSNPRLSPQVNAGQENAGGRPSVIGNEPPPMMQNSGFAPGNNNGNSLGSSNTIESIGERIPNGHQTDANARRINNDSVQSILTATGPWLETSAKGPKTIGKGENGPIMK